MSSDQINCTRSLITVTWEYPYKSQNNAIKIAYFRPQRRQCVKYLKSQKKLILLLSKMSLKRQTNCGLTWI